MEATCEPPRFCWSGQKDQQMRGSCAPVSLPRMRLPPKLLRSTTWPGRLAVTRPIWAAALLAAGHRLQRRQDGRGRLGGADCQHPALTGGIKGVQAQQAAGGRHRRVPPGWRLPPARCTGTSLRQISFRVVANAAAGGVPQHPHPAGLQGGGAQLMQRGGSRTAGRPRRAGPRAPSGRLPHGSPRCR